MTLTREWRSGIALTLAILIGLTAFVWGNQRHAQAATLAEQIICYVDWRLEQVDPTIPFDPQLDYCGDGEPTPPDPTVQCNDGIDNDNDGKIDWGVPGDPDRDPGCDTPTDNDESNDPAPPPPAAQCADGLDNDNDGLIDLIDPGCANAQDNDETNDGQGGGGGSPNVEENNYSGGGNGGGGGSRRNSSNNNNDNDGEVLGMGDCNEYLMGYIRYGAQNDPEQVSRLQLVLKTFEGAAININGTYDLATLAAVNAFQAKYASEVLAPWSLNGPTGYVYYTTRKKINEVFCEGQKAFPLTLSQLNEVAQVKVLNETGVSASGGTTRASTGTSATAPNKPASSVGNVVLPKTTIDQNAGDTNDTTGTTSADSKAAPTGWWGKFVKWLFGL